MDEETELTAWQDIGAGRQVATAARSTLPSLSSRMASLTDLIRVDRAEFAAELTPCLALTSGVGMSPDDQRTWLNAAYKALDGIPIKLLKRGAAAAMAKADHPSKIVPAIMVEVREDWDWRKRHAAARQPQPATPMLDRHDVSPEERKEVGAMMRSLVQRLEASAV